MLRYLLDTDTVIYVIKNRTPQMQKKFSRHADHLAISAITLAELIFGAENSGHVSKNLAVIEDFCSRLVVLPYAGKAAQHYGLIRSGLQKAGKIIGGNDLHIAAHARSEGLILVSNNQREFGRVPGLLLENWLD
ncbi:MAG: type II toxin-antitoxin system VapC family toxin [Arenimonas sp.]|nr:type II toxin-antitoxin system VapC family toxin [Arenimonas sp.]